jgi:hypothetical protein
VISTNSDDLDAKRRVLSPSAALADPTATNSTPQFALPSDPTHPKRLTQKPANSAPPLT